MSPDGVRLRQDLNPSAYATGQFGVIALVLILIFRKTLSKNWKTILTTLIILAGLGIAVGIVISILVALSDIRMSPVTALLIYILYMLFRISAQIEGASNRDRDHLDSHLE